MNILFGNYGNDSIALLQWAYESQFCDVQFISVDTGWAGESWQLRVDAAEALVKSYGFKAVRLQSAVTFSELITDRQTFPNQKFQFCPSILKGLPLLDYLDEIDPSQQAVIIMAKVRGTARINQDLEEFIEQSPLHGERRVWYPLFQHDITERDRLIKASGLEILAHQSLECQPCIHASNFELRQLTISDISKTAELEANIGQSMFDPELHDGAKNILELLENLQNQGDPAKNTAEHFYRGCGSPYACGE